VPIAFGPDDTVAYPSVVVEITPEELVALLRGRLKLPADWKVGEELALPHSSAVYVLGDILA
jgi:hypothetical protein